MTVERPHTIWIEVDLSAIRHNTREILNLVGPDVKLLAVVKANGYGHGAVETAGAVLAEGACCLGVTRIEDAVELREAGIAAPVLVFDSVLPQDAAYVVGHDLEQTVCSLELAEALSAAAQAQGRTCRVHIKIDTGMSRLGVLAQDAAEFARRVAALPGLEIAGVYTHFATAAEKDKSAAVRQLQVFDRVVAELKSAGVSCGLVHAAASAALLALPESRYDMVRPGTLLYGQYPSSFVPKSLDLRNTWTMKTRIAFIKDIPKGSSVGYGAEYITTRASRIAILPAGYSDGLTVAPESIFRRSALLKSLRYALAGGWPAPMVTIRGKGVPIVGRVAMEMCAVDVTDLPGVEIGDEVVLPCRRISASCRIPRVYKDPA